MLSNVGKDEDTEMPIGSDNTGVTLVKTVGSVKLERPVSREGAGGREQVEGLSQRLSVEGSHAESRKAPPACHLSLVFLF